MLVIQDRFFDPCLIEILHTAGMLRPSAPALIKDGGTEEQNINSGTNNQQQQMVEYFPDLIFVHNKAHLNDFTSRHVRKVQAFYAKIMAKQSETGQIGWKYDSKAVRMTSKVMSHFTYESLCSLGNDINLFYLPDVELSETCQQGNAGGNTRFEWANEISPLPNISFETLAAHLRMSVMGIQPRPMSPMGRLSERGWLNHAQKSWDSVKSSNPYYTEYGRILTA